MYPEKWLDGGGRKDIGILDASADKTEGQMKDSDMFIIGESMRGRTAS